MARVEISLQATTRAGLEPSYAAFNTGDGNYIDNTDQRVMLHVKNDDASAHVIHIISQFTADGKALKDIVVSIPAGEERIFGPFSNRYYGTSNQIQVDCYDSSGPTFDADDAVSGGTKDTTSVTAAAIQLGAL